jgi:hypothetical protein
LKIEKASTVLQQGKIKKGIPLRGNTRSNVMSRKYHSRIRMKECVARKWWY